MSHRLAAAALLLLLACTSRDAPPARTAADNSGGPPYSVETLPIDSPVPPPAPRPLPPRPEVRHDSVRIEGDWQRSRLRLVRSPAGFQPPFSTYLPVGLEVEFEPADSTPAVRFVAAFDGRRNPEAYLQVRLYAPGSPELEVRTAVEAYLTGRDPRRNRVTPSQGWPWSVAAWDFQYGAGPEQSGYLGTIAIGRYGNRFFHVLAHYPADYGDGVGPRFHRIIQEWRWELDGARLVSK
jgi:hypothetical protein